MGSFGKSAMTVARGMQRAAMNVARKGILAMDSSQLAMKEIKRSAKILARKPLSPVRIKLGHPNMFKQHIEELYSSAKYIPKTYYGMAEGPYNLGGSRKMTGTARNIKERILENRRLKLRDVKLGNMSTTPIQPLNMGPTMSTRLFLGKNPFFDRMTRFR